ncbi:serine hydroxymethyltransferase [Aquincola tertiaricarbonis]|uniref:Probable serine hydroxymethyltransferase n=1 Tax=Aquincola tertiaricarbonis TaxID=391953 RepID=A0ABY4S1Y5_AQUTE|nr:serine hydroxymethyltransferase [Aquincola tertiaricarbonis]URI07456.1 serine hydroxymethyltransferase [Aquincola tertiaricarbonis]
MSLTVHPGYFDAPVAQTDPLIAEAIAHELQRQQEVIELIASENIVSRAVLEVQGSILTNKTVEGYPGKRYHAGAAHVDAVERAAIERACQLFGCRFANVQPHSGSQANHAVLHAVAQPGETILAMDLNAGGHLSHGAAANFSGRWFQVVNYGVQPDTGLIDYDQVIDLARRHRPKLVIAGGSAYARALDFEAFRRAADAAGARLLVDMAHFAGLVAGGAHADPFPHADIVTTTTYKSLRGPRGAIVLWNDEALTKPINNAVFPGLQGTPFLHIVAGKAVALGEALRPEFKAHAAAVLANARALAARLQQHGYHLLGGGTDTPLMLVDLRPQGLTGAPAAHSLERAGLISNANPIPSDTADLKVMSGLRFGVSGSTTRGFGTAEFEQVGDWVAQVLAGLAANPQDNTAAEAAVAEQVRAMTRRFPIYGG